MDEAVWWCLEQGIVFDSVNEPLPEQRLKYGNDTRKVYADFYIDDRAMKVDELEDMVDQIMEVVQNSDYGICTKETK